MWRKRPKVAVKRAGCVVYAQVWMGAACEGGWAKRKKREGFALREGGGQWNNPIMKQELKGEQPGP